MKFKLQIFTLFTALIVCSAQVQAQTKYEREVRLRADSVPQEALNFMDSLAIGFNLKRVKWYKEFFEGGSSVEAKFKRDGIRYSLEFSGSGDLEDLEVEVDWENVSQLSRDKISEALNAAFEKWKIDKVQRQLVGPPISILEYFRNGHVVGEMILNYEIVIKGKSQDEEAYFEVLSSDNGEILSKSRIIENPSDILIY